MSDGETEHFEVWLHHQIDLARRKLKDEWTAIDRKAAAEGWYRSGRRIKVSIRVIADILRTLTAEAYQRAADSAVAEKLQSIATQDLSELFNELVAIVPTLVQSTGHASPRVEQAVAKLIAPIRSDLETSAKLARLSIQSNISRPTAVAQAAAGQTKKIKSKNPDDRKIIQAVLEALIYNEEEDLGITELIRDSARNLKLFPADIDEQIKLVDRIRRQVRNQQRSN